MLLLLLAGIYAGLLPFGAGIWLVRLLRASLKLNDRFVVATLSVWLAGLLLLTVLLEIASLVVPLHTAAHVGAVVIGVSGLMQPAGRLLLRRTLHQGQQWPWLVQLLAGLLLLYALFIGSMPSPSVDTSIYHAQSLRWLEEVGIVPGLANADIHIGFNSAWFVPEALFSWGRYMGSPMQVLNGTFFVFFGWQCLDGLAQLLRRQARLVDVVYLVLLLLLFQLTSDLASLSPDPAVAMLLFFIVAQVLVLPPVQPDQLLSTPQILVIMLCLFSPTVKLSTLPVLLLPLWWLGRSGQWRHGKLLLGLAAWGVVVMGPWLIRNMMLSGYPLFPSAFRLFSPSWQFPLAELRLHNDYITEFARSPTLYGQVRMLHTPLQYWVPIWWRMLPFENKALLVGVVGLVLPSLLLGWQQHLRGRLPAASRALVALILAIAGVLFWFLLAPAFRFGYGFLALALALLLAPWLWIAAKRAPSSMAVFLILALLTMFVSMPLRVHYSFYSIPNNFTRAEYNHLFQQLSDPADQNQFRSHFIYIGQDSAIGPQRVLGLARLRFILLVSRAGGLSRGGFDDTGRGAFVGVTQRLLFPAPYPVIEVQPLHLGMVCVLQSLRDQKPWYAPYPFVGRRRLCQANGTQLSDGFRPRLLPDVRDWRYEGKW